MTIDCRSFRVLCALESSGQLTDNESAILCEHCEHCILCREQLVAMRQLSMHLFLAQACEMPRKSLSKGVKERFAARAAGQGILFNSRSSNAGSPALGLVTMVLLVLSVITITLRTKPSIETKVSNNFGATAGLHSDQGSPPIISKATPVQSRGIRSHNIHPESDCQSGISAKPSLHVQALSPIHLQPGFRNHQKPVRSPIRDKDLPRNP